MKLYDKSTGKEISLGDRVLTFRGEAGIVTHMTPPHKPSSTGRVVLSMSRVVGGVDEYENEFFPSVINAEYR